LKVIQQPQGCCPLLGFVPLSELLVSAARAFGKESIGPVQ